LTSEDRKGNEAGTVTDADGAAATGVDEGGRARGGGQAQPPALDAIGVGDRVGRFEVERKLGEGGMGVVLAANDPNLERTVALKLLRMEAWTGEALDAARQRLLREAQAMARITHPNVVVVHEVGTVGERVFLAMEYVEGQTLGQWSEEAPRSWREVVDIAPGAGWPRRTRRGSCTGISNPPTCWSAKMVASALPTSAS